MKTKIKNIRKWLKKAPERIYNFLDRGDPAWLTEIWGAVLRIHESRKMKKLLKSFMPDYMKITNNSIFLHADKIPSNSDVMIEIKKLKDCFIENGFEKFGKVNNDNDSIVSTFYKKGLGYVHTFVYLNGGCEIEYVDEVVKKTKITGLCRKFIDELNSN